LLGVGSGRVGVRFEELGRVDDEIVVVDEIPIALGLLKHLTEYSRFGICVLATQAEVGPSPKPLTDAGVCRGFGRELPLRVLVEKVEFGADADELTVVAQHSGAEAVERAGLDSAAGKGACAQGTRFHLRRGLVREGEKESARLAIGLE